MITPNQIIQEMAARDACRSCPTLDLRAKNGWTFAIMLFLGALKVTKRADISWLVVTAPLWTLALSLAGFILFGRFVHAADRHKLRVEEEMRDEDEDDE